MNNKFLKRQITNHIYDTIVEFQDYFRQFEIEQFHLGKQQESTRYISADWVTANGNLGEKLLAPIAKAKAKIFLDGLIEIGCNTISLQIQSPLFFDDFPRNNEYKEFYQWAIEYAKENGLVVFVETSPAFSGTQYSDVTYDYSQLTTEQYLEKRYNQIIDIVSMKPHAISFIHEPDTEREITKLTIENTDLFSLLSRVLSYKQATESDILIAGGLPITYDFEDMIPYLEYVDILNIHFYPIAYPKRLSTVNALIKLDKIAQQIQKPIFLGETWVFKSTIFDYLSEKNFVELSTVLYNRNTWNFEGVDASFISALATIGNYRENFVGFNMFWSAFLFANIDGENMECKEAIQEINKLAIENIMTGQHSDSGDMVKTLFT